MRTGRVDVFDFLHASGGDSITAESRNCSEFRCWNCSELGYQRQRLQASELKQETTDPFMEDFAIGAQR